MVYQVNVVEDAEQDILDIYHFLGSHDSEWSAIGILDGLEKSISGLSSLPERGHTPPELKRINVTDFREIHYKCFRIIYEIDGKKVFVFAVLDGRRDIQDLLEKRLLR